MVAHEVVQNINKRKEPAVILKLDYEKAYDRVNLDFLFEILTTRGFSRKWNSWVESIMKGGSMGVTLNGNDSSFFKTERA